MKEKRGSRMINEIPVIVEVDKEKLKTELIKLREMDCNTCSNKDTYWCNSCFAGEFNYVLDVKVIDEIIRNCTTIKGKEEEE